ncbi:MAG: phosphoadenylyl-sulfate reductase [Thermogutta sp.]
MAGSIASLVQITPMSDKISKQLRGLDPVSAHGEAWQIDLSDLPLVSAEREIYSPTADQLERLRRVSEILEDAPAEDILRWAVETFYPSLTMATTFGPEGYVLLSMLARLQPKVRVFNLDTGYQFAETLELRDCIAQKYGIEVVLARPELSAEEYEKRNGGPLYKSNPDRCCFERKVQVLKREVVGYRAWISGIRRDQSPHRANAPIVGWDKKFGLVKINPLARWTKNQVWQKIMDEGIRYNPLHDRGYPSIGCWPCTRPVLSGEDERAGRWSGTGKIECGLHLAEDQPLSPPTIYGQI